MDRIVYKECAQCIRILKSKGTREDLREAWEDYLDLLVKDYLPSGSGIDDENSIDLDKSTPARIIINSAYHCMDGNGYYCGWQDFTVIIKPSLIFDIDMKISFHGVKEIIYGTRDYLYELYRYNLTQCVKDDDSIRKFM